MWTTNLKTTLAAALLLGLLSTGMGGLAWQSGGQVVAQAPTPALPVVERPPGPPKLPVVADRSLEEAERQLKALEQEIKVKRARLSQLQIKSALDEIEAALQKLRQATNTNPTGREAVEEFAGAVGKLRERLHASPANLHRGGADIVVPPGTRVHVWDRGGTAMIAGPISDGVVLKVDTEAGLVLLSVGKKEGVQLGDVYRTYQGDKVMPDQTGLLRVTEVSQVGSIATIVQNFAPRAPLRPQDIIQLDRKSRSGPARP
jgi:hypothetical protein